MDFFINRHVRHLYKTTQKHRLRSSSSSQSLQCRHQNTVVDYQKNDLICTDCGMVVGCPKPTTDTFERMQSYSTQTDVGSSMNSKYRTAQRRMNTQVLSAGERRIRRVRAIVSALCAGIGLLQKVEDRAQGIVKHIVNNKGSIKQVKKDELLCIVSICIACRENRIPYTFRELASACQNVKAKEICRTYKMYERQIYMKEIKENKQPKVNLESCSYNLMIPRFCGLLGMDFLAQKKIRLRLQKIRTMCYRLKALNPMTKFAVAVLTEFPDTPLEEVHVVTGVSKHTILKSVALFNRSEEDNKNNNSK